MTPDIEGNETRSDYKVVAKKVAPDDLCNDHINMPTAQCKHSKEAAADAPVMIASSLFKSHYEYTSPHISIKTCDLAAISEITGLTRARPGLDAS